MTHEPVPFLDLRRHDFSMRDAIKAAVARVLESQRFILGEEGRAFETECAAVAGCKRGVGVASGTDALLLAYKAMDLRPGDEVITTPFSFFATAGAIANAGARPVFADIDPVSFNLDPDAAAAAVTRRTRAICPVHLFGQPADLQSLREGTVGRDLFILEDAAQAIAARLHGKPVGSLGDAGAFSFFPTKNLGGIGDGGLLTTSRETLADKVRALRRHGETGASRHGLLGTNSRLDEVQAAVLRVKLLALSRWTEARRRNAVRLSELFRQSGLAVREGGALDGADVALPVEVPGRSHVYNLYSVRARKRDDLSRFLKAQGIGSGVYYRFPLHLQPCFRHLGYRVGAFPVAENACEEVIALPVFPGLTDAEMERVVAAVTAFYRQEAGDGGAGS
ncbi:MAG: DegT/DnrJ/EryC1/StrS family aminotransferase [Acidobacteriota bacterium]